MAGNTKLVDYGIQNDQSNLRAHVCIIAARCYVFYTAHGVKAIDATKHKLVPVHTGDIMTARGYLVPPDDIPGLYVVKIPTDWLSHSLLKIDPADSTTTKGARAALIVVGLLKSLRFPLYPASIRIVEDHDLQVAGVDVDVHINIQVKCDYKGGHKRHGGTGNLFLQVQECNPHGRT